MEQKLINQLNEWHEVDEHQRIVDTLLAIPEEERDDELISILARAYNNLGLYEEALNHFSKISEAGKQDALWHYRVGFAFYYLNRYEEAAQAFSISDQLDSGDRSTEYFLRQSTLKAKKQKVKHFGLPRRRPTPSEAVP